MSEAQWTGPFEMLLAFKAQHGHCNVPRDFPVLGDWCNNQRAAARKRGYLKERRGALAKIGFDFDPQGTQWRKMFQSLVAFKTKNGHINVPKGLLWTWCQTQRTAAKLPNYPQKRRQQLVGIGFELETRDSDKQWEAAFNKLESFKAQHGHLNIPASLGYLKRWCCGQRAAARRSGYPQERYTRLAGLGFRFETRDPTARWDGYFNLLVAYQAQHGHCEVPNAHAQLGRWCDNQRQASKGEDFPLSRRQRLESLGFALLTPKPVSQTSVANNSAMRIRGIALSR